MSDYHVHPYHQSEVNTRPNAWSASSTTCSTVPAVYQVVADSSRPRVALIRRRLLRPMSGCTRLCQRSLLKFSRLASGALQARWWQIRGAVCERPSLRSGVLGFAGTHHTAAATAKSTTTATTSTTTTTANTSTATPTANQLLKLPLLLLLLLLLLLILLLLLLCYCCCSCSCCCYCYCDCSAAATATAPAAAAGLWLRLRLRLLLLPPLLLPLSLPPLMLRNPTNVLKYLRALRTYLLAMLIFLYLPTYLPTY